MPLLHHMPLWLTPNPASSPGLPWPPSEGSLSRRGLGRLLGMELRGHDLITCNTTYYGLTSPTGILSFVCDIPLCPAP
jgi:hypothetical protein